MKERNEKWEGKMNRIKVKRMQGEQMNKGKKESKKWMKKKKEKEKWTAYK